MHYEVFGEIFSTAMLASIVKIKSAIQCNLNYPDLVYPEPRLSGLARDLKVHYHACAEGMTDDLLWVWL